MKNKKQILIVDDVPTNLRCLGEVLKENYFLSMAKSGEQALKNLEKVVPDLILLDVKMPEMDGYETLERIKGDIRYKDIPVIFLTADTEAGSELKGLRMGASDFIKKPFEPEIILERIEKVLIQDSRNKAIINASLKDALTGLWNRKYIENMISKFSISRESGSFLLLDLDNFKGLNDTYGHVVGDEALIAFANSLTAFIHKDDIVARIGGDEFVVFLKNSIDEASLSSRIMNLIKNVEEKISSVKKDDSKSSVSVGISLMPEHGSSFIELYNKADKALYYIKRNGKSGYHFYDSMEKYSFGTNASAELLDISQFKEFIKDNQNEPGPIKVNINSFKDIYNFVQRYAQRTEREIVIVLFTIKDLSKEENQSKVDKAMCLLDESVKKSLRKNDVSAEYSHSQYILILMDTNESNCDSILSRIMENWENDNDNQNIMLKYDFEMININR